MPLLQVGIVLGEQTLDPAFATQMYELFLKIVFMIGFGLYAVFAFVALRQIQVMRRTVVTPFAGMIMLIGLAHMTFSVVLFLVFLLTL